MALAEYNKKRKFKETPEPKGVKGKAGKQLHFVVQKHDASRLHYDFRLELDGVLLSWAVPKGPSMNPADKRLAMQTEDHPMSYMKFEGIIPEGNYGAGDVIVWDLGFYTSPDSANPAIARKSLKAGYKKGDLKFVLYGEKLKGGFALVKLKNSKDENAWLLIKEKDEYVSKTDITKKNKSVLSGRKLPRDGGKPLTKEWHSNKTSNT